MKFIPWLCSFTTVMPSSGTSGGIWGGDNSGEIFCSCSVWVTGSAVLGAGWELITGVSSTVSNNNDMFQLVKYMHMLCTCTFISMSKYCMFERKMLTDKNQTAIIMTFVH